MWGLKNDLKHLQKEKQEMQELVSSAKKRESAQRHKLQKLQVEKRKQQKEMEEKDRLITDTLEVKIMNMQKTHAHESKKLRAQLTEAKTDLNWKMNEVNELTGKLQELSSQLVELEKSKNLYSKKNAEQSKLIEAFAGQVHDLQSDVSSIVEDRENKKKSRRSKQINNDDSRKRQRRCWIIYI